MSCIERSVVQVGKNLSVNLPAGWCHAAGVKAGDKLHLDLTALWSEIPGIPPVYSDITISKSRKIVDRVLFYRQTPSELIAGLRNAAENWRGMADSRDPVYKDEDERKEYLEAAERAAKLAAAFEKAVKDGTPLIGRLFDIHYYWPKQLVLIVPERKKGERRYARTGELGAAWEDEEREIEAVGKAEAERRAKIARANAPDLAAKHDELIAQAEALFPEMKQGVRKDGKPKRQG